MYGRSLLFWMNLTARSEWGEQLASCIREAMNEENGN